MIETAKQQERAILVGVELQETENFDMSMEELASLAKTAGAEVVASYTQKRERYDSKSFVGSGKLEEIKAMVDAVRHVEAALGDGHKHLTESEAPNKTVARKSIVAARTIKAGEIFTTENLTTKRPGDGISPMRWYEVLGQAAKRDFAEDEKIEL